MSALFDTLAPSVQAALDVVVNSNASSDPVQTLIACLGVMDVLDENVITEWDSEKADFDFQDLLAKNDGNIVTAAKAYFSEFLQEDEVRTSIGLVHINSKTKGKMVHRLRIASALVIPRIPEILISGTVGEREPLNKDRSDDIVAFYTFEKTMQIGEVNITARIKVGELSSGLLAYYLAAKKEAPIFDSSWVDGEPKTRGLKKELKTLSFDSTISNELRSFEMGFDSNIPYDDDEINIEILKITDIRTGGEITLDEAESLLKGEEAAKELSSQAPILGRSNNVKTAKGTKIETRFALVEADSLIASHDSSGGANAKFPQELQPRDRSRETSQAWVQKVAASLDPDSLGRTASKPPMRRRTFIRYCYTKRFTSKPPMRRRTLPEYVDVLNRTSKPPMRRRT